MSLEPIPISSPSGSITGFKRPLTEEYCLIMKIEELINQSVRRVFAFYTPECVRKEYPHLPKMIRLDFQCCVLASLKDCFDNDPLAKKVAIWMEDFFQGGLRLACDKKTFYEIGPEIGNFCLKQMGFNPILLPEKFSDEELEILGIGTEENLVRAQKINPDLSLQKIPCYNYALLRAKEPGLADYMLFLGNGVTFKFFEYFPKWGYEPVLEPKKGDLVLYLQDGEARHLGLYMDNGQVESKCGSVPYFNRRPLAAFSSSYGNQIIFYRKVKPGTYTQPLNSRGFLRFDIVLKKG